MATKYRAPFTGSFMACVLGGSMTLTACGGGGGAGSTAPSPSIAASPSPVSVTATVADAAPTASVNLTFANAPANAVVSVDDTTTNGISSVSTPSYNSTTGSFTINFKTPSGLKPAVYTDTLTALLCSDAQCKVVVASASLQVNYTVNAASGSTAPAVAVDSNAMSYSALYVGQDPITVTPDPSAFTFSNFTTTPYVQVSTPQGATPQVGAFFAMSDATHGGLQMVFPAPTKLAQNTYTTPVTVMVCIDPNCVNQAAGSPLTVVVSYVVTNSITVAGNNGYTISAFPLATSLIASNSHLSTILAVVNPATAGSANNTVQSIDPTTGTGSLTPLLLSESPNTYIGLSDDGQYLYVNGQTAIEQVRTATLTAGLTIPSIAGLNGAISVMPGQPQTIAVGGGTVTIFDGTVARTNTAPLGYSYGALSWTSSTPPLLSANTIGNTLNRDCVFAVDANGVGAGNCVSAYSGAAPADANTGFLFAGGFGFGTAGSVLRESDLTVVGQLSVSGQLISGGVIPDATLGKVFATSSSTTTAGVPCSLQSFSLSTYAPIATVPLPTCALGAQLVRWGASGLALPTSTDIIVVRGAFVGP